MEKIINEIKSEFLYQIDKFSTEKIYELICLIKNRKGNIFFCGIGKSGNIANHCCDLFKCINIVSFYLNPVNLNHGDIGVIKKNDIIIMFSNSGNTEDLIKNIPLFKEKNAFTVGVCCNQKSKFNELCDFTIITPFNKEISGNINKIPTNSFMSQVIFTNIIVSILKNEITIDDYIINHLSGNIGNSLLKIKDKMIINFPKIIFENEEKLVNVLLLMTQKGIGCCIFVNKNNDMIGIITDGDIRRLLIKNSNLKIIKLENINRKYIYEINENKFMSQATKIRFLPIVKNNKPIGLLCSC